MKFITFLKKQLTLVFIVGMLLCLASCGSFQYSGIYDDGIYGDSNVVQQPTEQTQGTVKNTSDSNTSSNTSNYYTTYFKEKSLQIADDNTVFLQMLIPIKGLMKTALQTQIIMQVGAKITATMSS
jgi:hypothetical protein